jgi:cell division transport system permease protein
MRRLLPEQKRRTAPWIVGLMTFVSLIVGAAGLAVLGSVQDLRSASEGRWSLQVTGVAADAAAAERLLRSSPEVLSLAPVAGDDLRRELRRWLGPDADQLNLPLPRLADVTLKPGADGAALARRVEGAVGSARLSPYADELAPLLGSLRALSALVVGLLLVLALAMAAAVTLAARAALEANRTTLDIFHGIGATDAQLLSLLQRRIALDALIGGAAGGVAAVLVLALVALPGSALVSGLGGSLVGPTELLLLLLLPVAQALIATLVARRALRRALAATP